MKHFVQHQIEDGWDIHFFSDPAVQCKIENAAAANVVAGGSSVVVPPVTFHPIGKLNVHDASATTIEDKFQLKQTPEVANHSFPHEILPATVYYMDPTNGSLIDRVKSLHPTVIVSDVSALWGVLTAQILNVPLITSCSCTLFEDLEGPFGHFRTIDFLQKSSEWIKETYNIDYDPMYSYMNESNYTVAFSAPIFQPSSRQQGSTTTTDNNTNVKFYGPAMEFDYVSYIENEKSKDSAKANDESSLLKWLDDGKKLYPNRKVIFCSLGTVVGQEPWTIMERSNNNNNTNDNDHEQDMVATFYEKVFEVMKTKPYNEYQCIISIGKNRSIQDIKAEIPSNVKCVQCVPQVMLLELVVDVFITHCGNNGVHESFFTKTPMICIPIFGDQHVNAQSIATKLNCGIQIESPFKPFPSTNLDHVTITKLQEALNEIFITRKDEIQYNITHISNCMRQLHTQSTSNGYNSMMNYINNHHHHTNPKIEDNVSIQ